MPIYELKCDTCSNLFSKLLKEWEKDSLNGQRCKIENCSGQVFRTISICNFKINGYSEKNGYSKEKK